MEKIKIGIIGAGGMANEHVRMYRTHPAAEVVAVMDKDRARAKEFAERHGIPTSCGTAARMFSGETLDVVSVVTPNKHHLPMTLAALEAGCHVLCEKPMAMNASEGRRMVDAARKARRRLMINFSYRFTDTAWALKKQVETGVLGDVYYARTLWLRRRGIPGFGGWFGRKSLAGGGPLIDLGVHRLDLALWLMDYPKPKWVMGSTANYLGRERARSEGAKFDVEDFASACVQFEGGATLSLEASWASNVGERERMETRLLGTRAGLVQRNIGESYDWEAEIFVEREGCQFDMKLHPPVPSAKPSAWHFIEAIVDDRPHPAPGEEGLVVMEILDAVYESARKGAPVKIDSRPARRRGR